MDGADDFVWTGREWRLVTPWLDVPGKPVMGIRQASWTPAPMLRGSGADEVARSGGWATRYYQHARRYEHTERPDFLEVMR
jgi:hypothetical protein